MNRDHEQLGAACLAVAIQEVFPEAQVVFAEGTATLFFCDVLFPFAFRKDFLPLLEERIRLMGKSGLKVSLCEMVPSNAADLLIHKGQREMAHLLLEERRATVSLCRIGEAFVYLPDLEKVSLHLESQEVRLFNAFPVVVDGVSLIRVLGVWGKDKAEVKKRVKDLLSLKELISLPSGVWRGKGERWRDSFIEWICKRWVRFKVEKVAFCGASEQGVVKNYLEFIKEGERLGSFHEVSFEGRIEGLIAPKEGTMDMAAIAYSEEFFEQELISSLQFILEIPKIFSFESEVVVSVLLDAPKKIRLPYLSSCEKALKSLGIKWRVKEVTSLPYLVRVEVHLADALGRKWMGPFLGICHKVLFFSMSGSLERMAALLNMGRVDSESES
ncbi:MAG: hypothetical protein RLZZ453_1202 [Chlamydiota bacterium]|jgi:threonyl-tRNA synthetase